jgi:hypothetical protein
VLDLLPWDISLRRRHPRKKRGHHDPIMMVYSLLKFIFLYSGVTVLAEL